jgi:hypothetical protein
MVRDMPTQAPVHYLTVMLLLSFSAVIVTDMAIKPMRTNDEPTLIYMQKCMQVKLSTLNFHTLLCLTFPGEGLQTSTKLKPHTPFFSNREIKIGYCHM